MELFKKFIILEHQKAAAKEVEYSISIINKIYNEWRKIRRRINAIDIVATSSNKIANINPSVLDYIHDAAKAKLVIIIMRCIDLPVWKPLDSKQKIWRKLYPLISKLQGEIVKTGTGGTLRDVIMTRLSAAVAYQMNKNEVWICYEPRTTKSYIRFLFGPEPPMKTYRMQALSLPEDYESLIDILKINQEKGMKKFEKDSK